MGQNRKKREGDSREISNEGVLGMVGGWVDGFDIIKQASEVKTR
jgi:hypothetical protein